MTAAILQAIDQRCDDLKMADDPRELEITFEDAYEIATAAVQRHRAAWVSCQQFNAAIDSIRNGRAYYRGRKLKLK